jgi:ribonucleotide monophosphatase NagD (HAD superfamily)
LAVGKNLPAVCANPDYIVQTPSGDGVAFMPGKIAQRYEELGGTCTTFGKPGIEHFEACITKLDGIEKHRVAHVGDSLHHDIAGAANANIPCIFVTSGIHKLELGTAFGELPPQEKLEEVMTNEIGTKIRPTHVVPAFKM